MATILVVDDSAVSRLRLSTSLVECGHQVLEATNGAEGLGVARVEHPDVVITDLLMPKVDGYAFVRELRGDPATAQIPVVIYTAAYAEDEVRNVAEAYGITEVLTKSAEPTAVCGTVRRALRRPAASQEPPPSGTASEREHLAVLNGKLLEKVRELELADRERQRLVGHLAQAQEEERWRIATDIHDDSMQVMTAVAMRLEMLGESVSDPDLRAQQAKLEQAVRLAIARLRQLTFALSPEGLEGDGLAATLETYLERSSSEAGYAFVLEDRTVSQPAPGLRALLYRTAQEALVNVAKHARASKVKVVLDELEGGYLVRVEDDGVGFSLETVEDLRPGHLGLTSMRQRAQLAHGWWRIDSAPGHGTVVESWLPATPPAADLGV
ncbi:MAG TPA: response regulator [Egibacteraceae bacterium]|jgi:signal transduction histidine kinase|nr:response regulator [Egibacteraceae bacterium]